MGIEIEKRIVKYNNGEYDEIYHKKGDRYFYHREDGPAIISYNEAGLIEFEVYYINKKTHREDGPAYIKYNKDGSIYSEEYCINGRELSKEDWEKEYGWKLKLKGTPMGEIFKQEESWSI